MFHPMVAGVTIPGIGLFALILAPYTDRNPSNKPEDRKFAISLQTVHLMFWAVLVMIGTFFRGPGFNFTFPWREGCSSTCREAETMTALVIAIPVLVLLAAILLVSGARRRDTGEAVGALSPRDGQARPGGGRCAAPAPWSTRRAAARSSGPPPSSAGKPSTAARHRAERGARAVGAARSRDPRRHPPPVPQPLHHRRVGLRPLGVRRVAHRLPVAVVLGRLRLEDPRRQLRRHQPEDRRRQRLRLLPRGPHVDHRVPGVRPRQGPAASTPSTCSPAWRPASSRSTRSACTSAAGCRSARPRSGSSAPATARSTTGSARRRAARRLAASTASPLTVDGGALTVDTGTIIQGPPIGTNTTGQEAEGPHCIGTGGGGH